LATAQKRAPSPLRDDRKMVLVDLDACDRSIALNYGDSFPRPDSLSSKRFSYFTKTPQWEYT
ncbi:MAG TPA: hypothetical protein VEP29_04280, partial [Desulfatiglandales bacterium]|nr:hypothetical protein [Desulfatiglandales bacterium]